MLRIRLSSNCGEYQKPKGHLDTQMFPECEGYPADRDIVKKTRERRKKGKNKKKSTYDSYMYKDFVVSLFEKGTISRETAQSELGIQKQSKKKKPANETPYNPWAICNSKINKDNEPEKFERCVRHIKEKNLKSKKKKSAFNLGSLQLKNKLTNHAI